MRARTTARALFCMPVSMETVLATLREKPSTRATMNLGVWGG